MGLQGTLDTMPVVDLLLWMSKHSHTGMLTFRHGTLFKTLLIESGRVTNASSNDPREYFGQFLINFGLVTEDQLQRAFETQRETGVMLGKILVMTGLLTEDQVLRMLELKIRETFLEVFLWSEGTFDFQDGVVPDEPSVVQVAVDLLRLFQEGVARRERFHQLRQVIPENRCTFTPTRPDLPPGMEPASTEGIILELARQGFSAADIILRFHSLDFPILRTLHDLVQRGLLQVVRPEREPSMPTIELDLSAVVAEGPEKPAAGSPDQILLQAQSWMQQRAFEQAIGVLQSGLREHPYDPDISDALQMAERGLVEVLRAELATERRIPYLVRQDVMQSRSDWSPAERYILSRIDGRRSLRSIVMVSPLKEIEALRTFQALIKGALVGLR